MRVPPARPGGPPPLRREGGPAARASGLLLRQRARALGARPRPDPAHARLPHHRDRLGAGRGAPRGAADPRAQASLQPAAEAPPARRLPEAHRPRTVPAPRRDAATRRRPRHLPGALPRPRGRGARAGRAGARVRAPHLRRPPGALARGDAVPLRAGGRLHGAVRGARGRGGVRAAGRRLPRLPRRPRRQRAGDARRPTGPARRRAPLRGGRRRAARPRPARGGAAAPADALLGGHATELRRPAADRGARCGAPLRRARRPARARGADHGDGGPGRGGRLRAPALRRLPGRAAAARGGGRHDHPGRVAARPAGARRHPPPARRPRRHRRAARRAGGDGAGPTAARAAPDDRRPRGTARRLVGTAGPAQLWREIEAQLAAFAATGLRLAHLDGHLNMHLHPMVLPILLELAPRYGIRAMRLSREDLGAALRYDRSHVPRKLAEGVVFHALAAYAAPRLRAAGIATADRVCGMHQTGHVDERYLLALLAALPPGVSEVYCHPAEGVAPAMAPYQMGYDRAGELAALTSARVREAVHAAGVELVSYAELAR